MNRNNAIIATVASGVLCGCPGLVICLSGVVFAATSQMPDAEIDVFGSSDPTAALLMGLGFLCVSLIFIAIPVAVGFFTLRRAPATTTPPPAPSDS